MSKRKSIGKKLRLDVFKRDGFKCAYCGKTPPEVVLEVDHIEPVSAGGDNDINNLITACFDCNRGKSDTPLDKSPSSLSANLEVLKEKEEQLREYRRLVKKIQARITKEANSINDIFSNAFPGWVLSDGFRATSVKQFLSLLPYHEVEEAAYIAVDKMSHNMDRAIKYFCGVCWRKIKGDSRY